MKVFLPKGTRDFSPKVLVRRNYIFSVIKEVFEKYGYVPIETPAMENLETLTGKYGDEGDRLIFKILNSGDYLKKVNRKNLEDLNTLQLSKKICEKALRYDLTIPFARYVVMNRHEITFPFKRYQIQPVWRADRPQKGRFREFYQCDVDVIGSDSLSNEAELVKIFDEVLSDLDLPGFTVKVNNRKILAGLSEIYGFQEQFIPFTVAIDKLAKIGWKKVEEELKSLNITLEALHQLKNIFDSGRNNEEKADYLMTLLRDSAIGKKGVEEIKTLIELVGCYDINKAEILFDLTLARGLNYYTGCIFEVEAHGVEMGSICGGGRYDDLTGVFGMPEVSGVGISFGADRIYEVMDALFLFPESVEGKIRLMFANFGEEEEKYCIRLAQMIRKEGVATIIYPENTKLKKQLFYANNNLIPYVAFVGEQEVEKEKIVIKDMGKGTQKVYHISNMVQLIKDISKLRNS